MNKQNVLSGLTIMLFKGIVVGLANVLFFAFIMNGLAGKADEVAVNTYVLNFFVGWVFFSVWFLAKADEEWKKVAEAVVKGDYEAFAAEAPKRIALSIRALYLMIAALVVLSFHLFHIESPLALFEIQFGIGFLVSAMTLVLWDLDDPTSGVINVPNIPKEWIEKLKKAA